VVGAALVSFLFPTHDRELALLDEYHEDAAATPLP